MQRHYSITDKLITEADKALTTLWGQPPRTERITPGKHLPESQLSEHERRQSVRLMRVNHAGEVSAQALYQGQALTAHDPKVKETMSRAAAEENDHLHWCRQRIESLGGRTSLLDPLWYAGSLMLGAAAGKAGDKWSLGFVAETEKQVIEHLDNHLGQMSESDEKSRAVIEQMRIDEAHHGETAKQAGAAPLPAGVQWLMQRVSKLMTQGSYWV